MQIFTIENGKATLGATIDTATVANGTVKLAVVQVGESGRGCKLSYVPVQLLNDVQKQFDNGEKIIVDYADVTTTAKGGAKLRQTNNTTNTSSCIVVLRTHIGFRGGNSHTGDRTGTDESGKATGFAPFPASNILATGRIAQGDAGAMGSGEQLIAVIPINTVFRTAYTGRLYGAASSHYHIYDGNKIISLTWDERLASDLF